MYRQTRNPVTYVKGTKVLVEVARRKNSTPKRDAALRALLSAKRKQLQRLSEQEKIPREELEFLFWKLVNSKIRSPLVSTAPSFLKSRIFRQNKKAGNSDRKRRVSEKEYAKQRPPANQPFEEPARLEAQKEIEKMVFKLLSLRQLQHDWITRRDADIFMRHYFGNESISDLTKRYKVKRTHLSATLINLLKELKESPKFRRLALEAAGVEA